MVVGLSMGGALTLWLAADHPEIAGIVCINAVVTAPEGMAEGVQALLDAGEEAWPASGPTSPTPTSVELAYAADAAPPAAHHVRGGARPSRAASAGIPARCWS